MMNSLELFKDSNYLEKEESEGEGGGSGEVNAMHRHFNLVLGQGVCLKGLGENMREWQFVVKVSAALPSF